MPFYIFRSYLTKNFIISALFGQLKLKKNTQPSHTFQRIPNFSRRFHKVLQDKPRRPRRCSLYRRFLPRLLRSLKISRKRAFSTQRKRGEPALRTLRKKIILSPISHKVSTSAVKYAIIQIIEKEISMKPNFTVIRGGKSLSPECRGR